MSYSVVVSGFDRSDDVPPAMRTKFDELYPSADDKVKRAHKQAAIEAEFLIDAVYGPDVAEGHTYTVSISGHVQGADDNAPEFVSVQVSLNPKPESAEEFDDEPASEMVSV